MRLFWPCYVGAALGFPLLYSASSPALAGGPSFDCTQAMLPAEGAICSDPKLAEMDDLIATAFAIFKPEFGNKRRIGRALLADRDACGADTACLAVVEVNALDTYGAAPGWATAYMETLMGAKAAAYGAAALKGVDQPLPSVIGGCAMTHITAIGTRFSESLPQEDNGEGSRVEFANESVQISYDHEAPLASSRIGDPVVTCLISIPRDCPTGDDRGRGYFSLNLRTKGHWNLGDSQHMCGGA